MKIVSIIVPIYRVEKYLNQCLDSLINQTYSDIEIILIDDCSDDNSLDIMIEYASKDGRIKVIKNKKNIGLSATRNVGILASKGCYICFVDSDDWVESNMVEKMVNNMHSNDSDFVIATSREYDNLLKRYLSEEDPYFSLSLYNNCKDNSKEFLLKNIGSVTVTAWAKLYKSSIIKNNNLLFPEGINYEDNVFFLSYILNIHKFSFLFGYVYSYRVNRYGSINKNSLSNNDIFRVFYLMEQLLIKYNYSYMYKNMIYTYKIYTLLSFFNRKQNFSLRFLQRIRDEFLLIENNYVPEQYKKDVKRIIEYHRIYFLRKKILKWNFIPRYFRYLGVIFKAKIKKI